MSTLYTFPGKFLEPIQGRFVLSRRAGGASCAEILALAAFRGVILAILRSNVLNCALLPPFPQETSALSRR